MRRSDAVLTTIQFTEAIRYGIMECIGKPAQKFWVKVRAEAGGLLGQHAQARLTRPSA